MDQKWLVRGNTLEISQVPTFQNKLENKVYRMQMSMEGPYLELLHDGFEFNYKLYDISYEFVNRVVKTFKNTKDNLGILMNGIKGTGKTVTAELITRALNLPVIIIASPFSLSNFLNDIKQDVIIFVDEYEKVYEKSGTDSEMLSLMDGALGNGYRRVFLFTTNQPKVNDNMIDRPGRIRYIREFGNLSLKSIMEIVDDKLVHKHLKECTVKAISRLNLITIDIVKAVIDEVNIHEEDPKNFIDVMNIRVIKENISMIHHMEKENKVLRGNIYGDMEPNLPFTDTHVGWNLIVDGKNYGEIKKVINDRTLLVEEENYSIKESKYTIIEQVYEFVVSEGRNPIFVPQNTLVI